MALMVVLHRVADYDAWRKVYDEFESGQAAGGVTREEVHQEPDDPNNVLVLHYFDSVEKAREFVASDDLKDAMKRAGVEGQPRVEVYE